MRKNLEVQRIRMRGGRGRTALGACTAPVLVKNSRILGDRNGGVKKSVRLTFAQVLISKSACMFLVFWGFRPDLFVCADNYSPKALERALKRETLASLTESTQALGGVREDTHFKD